MQIDEQARSGLAAARSRWSTSPVSAAAVRGAQRPLGGFRGSMSLLTAAVLLLAAFGLGTLLDARRSVDVAAPGSPLVDTRTTGQRAVEEAHQRLARGPNDGQAMTRLATAYLVRVRETADATYYVKAEALLTEALTRTPEDFEAMVAASSLAAARHEFAEALRWARAAVEVAPERPVGYGVLTDALVELGQYEEAVAAAQTMVNLRPDQASYARISYLRELYGDTTGAIAAMRQAIEAGAPHSEATAWSEYQLGNLLLSIGDVDAAETAYVHAGLRQAGYVYGVAGRARVQAMRGDLAGSATLYKQAVDSMPLPEFAASLGDVYQRMGWADQAAVQHEVVVAFQRLQAANGVNIDIDLALYNADHDVDLEAALESARAEYARRPTVHVADALAWIEYRRGDLEDAFEHSAVAVRLGSRDPLMLYRAGVIAQTGGEEQKAMEFLTASHELSPQFSIRWAPDLAKRVATPAAMEGDR